MNTSLRATWDGTSLSKKRTRPKNSLTLMVLDCRVGNEVGARF